MAVNSPHTAKWVWCYTALHFRSFYFTDPPASDGGTQPKQLHSNNLKHLSLARESEFGMTHAVCAFTSVSVMLGSFDMQFDLQVGVGTLVVAKPLDAEVQSVYNMTVQVTDGTSFATAQVHKALICVLFSCTDSVTLQVHIKLLLTFFLGNLFPSRFLLYIGTSF